MAPSGQWSLRRCWPLTYATAPLRGTPLEVLAGGQVLCFKIIPLGSPQRDSSTEVRGNEMTWYFHRPLSNYISAKLLEKMPSSQLPNLLILVCHVSNELVKQTDISPESWMKLSNSQQCKKTGTRAAPNTWPFWIGKNLRQVNFLHLTFLFCKMGIKLSHHNWWELNEIIFTPPNAMTVSYVGMQSLFM